MRVGFFLGCNMPAIRPDVERAIRLTMPKLGVEIEDLPGYVCCPAFGTFPSLEEDAQLAVNAWNLSLGEGKGVDLMVECGSCYSSLRSGYKALQNPEKRERANELLKVAEKHYKGEAKVRHITDVLLNEVGLDAIRDSVDSPLRGTKVAVQYPCHTLFPSDIVGFETSSARPKGLALLVEALGAEVVHFSREFECCGGAGGFHTSSKHAAAEYAQKKLDSIIDETDADCIVASCITCLMHLDNEQKELNELHPDNARYVLPVFDFNQLLALAMGFPIEEVASISAVDRAPVTCHFAP